MRPSGTAHPRASLIIDLLQHTMFPLHMWASEAPPTLTRILRVKSLEARKPILYDMLVPRRLVEGGALLPEPTFVTEKFYPHFDGTTTGPTGPTGPGEIENFLLMTAIHWQHGTRVHFMLETTLETGPCPRIV
jgi:hypothetical protein